MSGSVGGRSHGLGSSDDAPRPKWLGKYKHHPLVTLYLRAVQTLESWRVVVPLFVALETVAVLVQLLTEVTYSFDWDAYMEEVSGVIHAGHTDYSVLHGDTGALVYPAGFVWLYGALYVLTGWDHTVMTTEYVPKNISGYEHRTLRPAGKLLGIQLLFVAVYALYMYLCMETYRKSRAVPAWSVLLLCVSRRVRAIFFLGFFNDCFATVFVCIAILYFIRDRWTAGCVWFSLAVSIKMNVLLLAPGLLVLLLERHGVMGAVKHIGECAAVQLVLGAPFLLTHPVAYVGGAFNLGRKFFQEWSVNFQFLPAAVFTSSVFALLLIIAQLVLLVVFAARKWSNGLGRIVTLKPAALTPDHIITTLYSANLIGIFLSRSLHYQFLVWYMFCVPYVLARAGRAYPVLCFAVVLALEIFWNEHPPAWWSSMGIQICHALTLLAMWHAPKAVMAYKNVMEP